MICGGDFNAGIGKDDSDGISGPYGQTRLDGAGRELRNIINMHEMCSPLAFCRSEHEGTWVHPRSKSSHQLDHIFVEKAERKLVRKCKISHVLVDSDHFSIRLHISLLSPAGRTKSIRQKRNGLDFQSKCGSSVSDEDMQEAGKEISNLCKTLRDTNPTISRHDCLLMAIEQGIESLPKKKTGKKGWYEGNEKELVEWIEKRNAATLRHATTKNHDDLVHLRTVRATLKKLKRKSKNDWWMKLLRQCNATVNPSANDNKYPGNIWST